MHRGDTEAEKIALEQEEEEKEWQLLDFKEYDDTLPSNTTFFTTSDATPIFRDLLEYLRRKNIKAQIDSDYWKLTFTIPDAASAIDVKVKLLRVDDNKLAVEFTRKKGDQLKFFEHYKKMMQDELVASYKDTVLNE